MNRANNQYMSAFGYNANTINKHVNAEEST